MNRVLGVRIDDQVVDTSSLLIDQLAEGHPFVEQIEERCQALEGLPGAGLHR